MLRQAQQPEKREDRKWEERREETGREMLRQAQQPESSGKSKREKSKNIIKITLPAGA
jgi:hypothetical protein